VVNLQSLNVLKVYQAIAIHIERHPNDAHRFPNFFDSKPILARGANGPLTGDLHSAHYFHGRSALADIVCYTSAQAELIINIGTVSGISHNDIPT
jgi:hypothetical protein